MDTELTAYETMCMMDTELKCIGNNVCMMDRELSAYEKMSDGHRTQCIGNNV